MFAYIQPRKNTCDKMIECKTFFHQTVPFLIFNFFYYIRIFWRQQVRKIRQIFMNWHGHATCLSFDYYLELTCFIFKMLNFQTFFIHANYMTVKSHIFWGIALDCYWMRAIFCRHWMFANNNNNILGRMINAQRHLLITWYARFTLNFLIEWMLQTTIC